MTAMRQKQKLEIYKAVNSAFQWGPEGSVVRLGQRSCKYGSYSDGSVLKQVAGPVGVDRLRRLRHLVISQGGRVECNKANRAAGGGQEPARDGEVKIRIRSGEELPW